MVLTIRNQLSIIMIVPRTCDCGGTGRRARLRGVWATPVRVQVSSIAPDK